MSKFRRGTIAMNELGQLGYIRSIYDMEMGGSQYRGMQLGVGYDGELWFSSNPKFVCHVDDLRGATVIKIEPVGPRVVTMPHGLTPCPALAAPLRDDDPVPDCSGGEIGGPLFEEVAPLMPHRRSCI